MLIAIAKFGNIHSIAQTDIGLIEGLQAAGYVARDPNNPAYALTARGWAFVHKAAQKGE